jgi:hypothetical protein
MISGEDLSNVGPVALLEDLAVAANLGIESIERNSQHYFRGLSSYSQEIQEQMVRTHGDLYHWQDGPSGRFATATISDGRMSTESVLRAPLGVGIDLNLSGFKRLEEWTFESLGQSR